MKEKTTSACSEHAQTYEKRKGNEKRTLIDVISILQTQGKSTASKIFQMKYFTVAETPEFMKRYGLTGEKFTIAYGTIARHFGKDKSHNLTQQEWMQLPDALKNPFAITRLRDKKDAYRIYTELKNTDGEYVVVGVDVKNAGRDLEVNAIATVFGRRKEAKLTKNEEVLYRNKRITPDQSSLLRHPNYAQYPTNRGLSENKGTLLLEEKQAEWITSPTLPPPCSVCRRPPREGCRCRGAGA